jgi:poly-gamma-glutamate capsule biosynthesis protein CapA/YwtB (metallophosphatase superfamily)
LVKITITGDISFNKINQFQYGSKILELFESSDLVIGNLEAPLTERTEKIKFKSYYLKAAPAHIENLLHFDAFSIANNHVLDYQVEGLVDTLELLDAKGIKHFGAGLSRQQAYEPYTTECNGVKIAVFGATQYFRVNPFRKIGTADMFSYRLLTQIKQHKKEGYFVIVMPHWGYEHVAYPSPRERRLAHRFIDVGADVVIGSHPHEMQGREQYKGKFIFYSLGNFIFSSLDYKQNSNLKLYNSYLVELNINPDMSYQFSQIPYVTSDDLVEIALGETKETISKNIELISKSLNEGWKLYKKVFYYGMYMRYLEANDISLCTRDRGQVARIHRGIGYRIRSKLMYILGLNWQTIKIGIYVYCYIFNLILKYDNQLLKSFYDVKTFPQNK